MNDFVVKSAFVLQRITQHKRFVLNGTHPNPSIPLRTSFMLERAYEIVPGNIK
jgi:hypothetical protein